MADWRNKAKTKIAAIELILYQLDCSCHTSIQKSIVYEI